MPESGSIKILDQKGIAEDADMHSRTMTVVVHTTPLSWTFQVSLRVLHSETLLILPQDQNILLCLLAM